MKYLIASDLHGDINGYIKLKDLILKENFDKLILLGDLTNGYDVEPINNVLDNIYIPIQTVMGNCDNTRVMESLHLGYLGFIHQESIGNRNITFTHGHRYNLNAIPGDLNKGDVLLYGHFHSPEIIIKNDVVCCCVGSVSYPRGYSAASYAVLTDTDIGVYNINTQKAIIKYNFE